MKQTSHNMQSKDYASVKLTQAKLASIDFANVVYGERSQAGAMGNAGGIILYELKDGKFTRYNTNVFDDEKTCLAALKLITKNEHLFDIYYGGMGNGVIVNKSATLLPDEKQNCFWLETKADRFRVDASVQGVFMKVAKQLAGEEPGGLDRLQKDWEESLRRRFQEPEDAFDNIIKIHKLDARETQLIKEILELNGNTIDSFALRAVFHRGWAVCERISADLIPSGIAKRAKKKQKIILPKSILTSTPIMDTKESKNQSQKTNAAKILLVEDDEALAAAYSKRLKQSGFEIKAVYNGTDALSETLAFKPDLILTGILMPKISGFDVIDILKNTEVTSHIPVLVLSALHQPRDIERAKKLGAVDYLVKSQVVVADVITVIESILKDKNYKPFSFADSNQTEAAPERTMNESLIDKLKERNMNIRRMFKRQGSSQQVGSFPLDILEPAKSYHQKDSAQLNTEANQVLQVIQAISTDAVIESVKDAPRYHRYIFKPIKGGKVEDVDRLERAIAQELDSHLVRVVVGEKLNTRIEVQIGKTRDPRTVSLREALESDEFQNSSSSLSFPVGMDVDENIVIADFKSLPHLLTAGQTGSGKSNFTEGVLIPSLLYKNSPDDLMLILIDPKYVQFPQYNGLPHLVRPVINTPDDCKDAFDWLLKEMKDRYQILTEQKKRNIEELNKDTSTHLPYIVTIIDEFADLMMIDGKYYEASIIKLLQLGRGVGIHLYVGTSRPSVDVIPGKLKANFPSRIAFTTASKVDSRTIIDQEGAERLLGRGDLLFCDMQHPRPIRLQAPFGDEPDIDAIVKHLKKK